MILICGAGVAEEQLPLRDTLEYTLITEPRKVKTTLMLGIRKSDVARCYINNTFKDIKIPEDAMSKAVYFDNDAELLALLSGGSAEAAPEVEKPEERAAEVEQIVAKSSEEDIAAAREQLEVTQAAAAEAEEKAKAEAEAKAKAEEKSKPKADKADKADTADDATEAEAEKPATEEIEEAADDIVFTPAVDSAPSSLLTEYDMIRAQLNATEKVLEQNRETLRATTADRDSLLTYAEEQLDEQSQIFDDKLKEAQEVIESLKAKLIEATQNAHPETKLGAFDVYADKPRAIIKQGIEATPFMRNIFAVTAGSSDSLATTYQQLALLAASGFKGYILDFVGDPLFELTLSQLKYRFLQLQNAPDGARDFQPLPRQMLPEVAIDRSKNMVKYLQGQCGLTETAQMNFWETRPCCCNTYHEIMLLTLDWGNLIEKIRKEIGDVPVILILPPITSFVGRYVTSYLATAIPTSVFTTCAPASLSCTSDNLAVLPNGRVRVMALNYIKMAESDATLNAVAQRFSVTPFKGDRFFADLHANRAEYMEAVKSSQQLWNTVCTA